MVLKGGGWIVGICLFYFLFFSKEKKHSFIPSNDHPTFKYILVDHSFYLKQANQSNYQFLSTKDSICNLVNQFRFFLENHQRERWVILALQLYKILIEPIRTNDAERHWQLDVCDCLRKLPFDALLKKNPKNINGPFAEWPFLLKEKEIVFLHNLPKVMRGKSLNNTLQIPVFIEPSTHSGWAYLYDDWIFYPKLKQLITERAQLIKEGFVSLNDSLLNATPQQLTTLHVLGHHMEVIFPTRKDKLGTIDFAFFNQCISLFENKHLTIIKKEICDLGISTFIATISEIKDGIASKMAHLFYSNLNDEKNLSVALWKAKKTMLYSSNRLVTDPMNWATYVIYKSRSI